MKETKRKRGESRTRTCTKCGKKRFESDFAKGHEVCKFCEYTAKKQSSREQIKDRVKQSLEDWIIHKEFQGVHLFKCRACGAWNMLHQNACLRKTQVVDTGIRTATITCSCGCINTYAVEKHWLRKMRNDETF